MFLTRLCCSRPYTFVSPITGRIFNNLFGYERFFISSREFEEESIVHGFDRVPKIEYYFNKRFRLYTPDFYIENRNLIIEVKSASTLLTDWHQNMAKRNASRAKGYKYEFRVYNRVGERLTELEHQANSASPPPPAT